MLTNYHIVQEADALYIGVNGTQQGVPPEIWYRAEVIATDEQLNIALLHLLADEAGNPLIQPLQLVSVKMGDSDAVRLQDPVVIWSYTWPRPSTFEQLKQLTITVNRGTVKAFTLEADTSLMIVAAKGGAAIPSGMVVDRDGYMIGIAGLVPGKEGTSVTLVRPVNLMHHLLAYIPPVSSPSHTPTPTPSETPTSTSTPTPTETPAPTNTPVPTFTLTPVPSDTPTFTPAATPSNTPTITALPLPIPAETPTHTATPSPTPLPVGEIILLKPLPPDNTTAGPTHFEWLYGGVVQPDQGFEVRVWPEGSAPLGAHDAVEANLKGWVKALGEGRYALDIDISQSAGVQGRSGEYWWSVALVQVNPTYRDLGIQAVPSRLHFVPPGEDRGEWHPTF